MERISGAAVPSHHVAEEPVSSGRNRPCNENKLMGAVQAASSSSTEAMSQVVSSIGQ